MSLSCPGVSRKVINLPWFSQRMWIFVLIPPRLRPKASASALLFLPRQHAGVLAPWLSRCNGSPNQRCSPDQAGSAAERIVAPIFPTCANVESGCTPLSIFHIFLADPAMVLLCVRSTTWHSRFAGDLPQVVPFSVSGGSNPFRRSHCSFVKSPRFPMTTVYYSISHFAYRP